MDTRYLAFSGPDPDFYDVPWSSEAEISDLGLPPDRLPPAWQQVRSGPWLVYRGPGPIPESGWKVHVCARPERAAGVVDKALDACLSLGVQAKCLASTALVRSTQAKYADRASSGKVVTAYPVDEESLGRLLAVLAEALEGEPGARILGDIPVPGAPVSVRFGAFLGLWTNGPDGRPRPGMVAAGRVHPDLRPPHGAVAAAPAPLPRSVQELADAASVSDERDRLDVSEVRLLHRSNSGGVFRARWGDRGLVVLKEARHHTGFDAGGADAVTRLRHEHRALLRLSGSGAAPEPVDYLTRGQSDFLVMEWIDGTTAAALLATTHPGVMPGGAAANSSEYRDWMEGFLTRTARAVAAAHACAIVHQDLHPGNLIDTGERVVMVDLESSSIDGTAVSQGVRSAVFAVPGADGMAADEAALRRLETALVSPVAVVLARRPRLEEDLLAVGRADLQAGGRMVAVPAPAPQTRTSTERILAGLRVAATPERPDRLFPGDVAQFRAPGACLGLLHGAAGVLLALQSVGADIPQRWHAWLADRAPANTAPRGLGDGLDGVAMALAQLGHEDLALRLSRGFGPSHPAPAGRPWSALTTAPWWASGRSGLAVAAAELAARLGEDPLWEQAEAHARSAISAVEAHEQPPGYRPGLLAGWAGVALGLLRVAHLVPDTGDTGLADACVDAARRAVERESEAATRVGTGLLARDGHRLMPYLGVGTAALGYAAQALAEQAPAASFPGLVGDVAETLRCPVVLQAGLLNGRAGNLLVLERLAPGDPAVAGHRARLGWHALPGPETRWRREHNGADFMLGDQNLRCSADLGSGAAGVLLSLDCAATDPLGTVLRLPHRIEPASLSPEQGPT